MATLSGVDRHFREPGRHSTLHNKIPFPVTHDDHKYRKNILNRSHSYSTVFLRITLKNHGGSDTSSEPSACRGGFVRDLPNPAA